MNAFLQADSDKGNFFAERREYYAVLARIATVEMKYKAEREKINRVEVSIS